MRNAVKQVAAVPGVARHSELLARFHRQARLAETRRESPPPVFASREQLYAHVNEIFFDSGRTRMDFLEFGVFEGASLRSWSALNRNPETRFWGFDSFEGLPEDWHSGKEKGTFSTEDKVPELGDPRVQYVVGWFQQTLPQFAASYHDRLMIHKRQRSLLLNPVLPDNDGCVAPAVDDFDFRRLLRFNAPISSSDGLQCCLPPTVPIDRHHDERGTGSAGSDEVKAGTKWER
jgi:hypothetical protein